MDINKIGQILINNFKAGLQQLGTNQQKVFQQKECKPQNDAVEQKNGSNNDSKDLLNVIKKEYSSKNNTLETAEQEYLDALESWEEEKEKEDNVYLFNEVRKQVGKSSIIVDMHKNNNITSEKTSDSDKDTNVNPHAELTKSYVSNKLKGLGANGDIETTKNADGTYSAVEKGDGFEVSYTLDKNGNVTSYTNAIGTFTAQDDSVIMSPNDTGKNNFIKWSREVKGNSYTIQNTKVEDIISAIKSSGPDAEKVINVALNLYDPNNPRHNKSGASCVNYTSDVEKEFGVDIGGTTSAEVKENGKEISYEDTKTGDILNRNRHIGIVLMKIDVESVNRKTGKLEKHPLIITADNGVGIDITIRDGKDDSLNINQIRFFKGASGNDV